MSSDNPGTAEEGEFARIMQAQGVRPLSQEGTASSLLGKYRGGKAKPISPREAFRYRREQAVCEAPLVESDDISGQWLGPHDIVEFSRPGVQQMVFRDLKRGKLRPLATLDLHRCTVAEARHLLSDFVRSCRSSGFACVLVMHGKGFHSRLPSPEGGQPANRPVARIKSFVSHWLQQMPEVLAMASAQPKDGGTGAVYVLLAKVKK